MNQESNATNALGLAILLAANGFAWLVIGILIGWGIIYITTYMIHNRISIADIILDSLVILGA